MGADQEQFRAPYNDVRLGQLGAAGADGLDFPSLEDDPGFEPLLDEIVEAGFPVFCNASHRPCLSAGHEF